MKVCIAEKPSVAREIAEVLGATKKMNGYIEGNGYQVTWTFGHLCTLKEPNDYSENWKRWSLASLPMIPPRFGIKLISNPTYEQQFKTIEELMQNAEMVINCGDAGQEGELIQRWVMQKAGCKCPVYRLWISSLTEEAIREGFQHLKEQSDFTKLYEAGLSRAIGDWLLGMNATRLYTLRYGQNRQVLSIGRVQTPTLALIVNRQAEIDNFKPEPYWELKTVYRNTTFSVTKGKFTKKEEGEAFLEIVRQKEFTVTDISEKKGKEYAPRLFDLTSLQVECNKKFAFTADDTLKLIQSLYEKKVTTYPRVDTTFLSDDIYPKVPNTLNGLVDYIDLTASLLKAKIRKDKRVFDNSKVTDHHAIIPTDGKLRPESLSEDERKVFSLVAARFLAVFYPYYRYEVTKVYAEAEQERFLSKGTVVLEEGWQAVEKALVPTATKKKKTKNEEEQKLPSLQEGEVRTIRSMELLRKKTKPPAPYTESSLLSAMENAGRFVEDEALKEQMKDSGLGTPATRAAIIERLLTVGYLTRKGKTLLPTEKGRKLIEVVPQEMRSPQTTGKWEKGLSSIAKGKMTEERFMASIRRYVQFLIQDAASGRRADVIFPEEQVRGKRRKTNAFGKCPFCGRDILENSKSFYCAGWKSGCKFSLWKDSLKPYGLELDGGMVKLLLKKNKSERVAVTLPQTGEKGTAVLILNKDKGGQIELMDFTRENA